MDPGNSIPNLEKQSAPSGAVSHAVVRAALVVSIFAFLPPLALAAIVMGHIAEKRGVASPRNGRSMARAALWIAYIQLLIVLSVTFIFWTAFRRTAISFQRDALVQRFFRSSDREQPLD
jgi:Na+-driven multidrug efflux pump